LIDELLQEFESGNYEALSGSLKELLALAPQLQPEEARQVYRLLDSLQLKLKERERELLTQLENSRKVKDSYGKCF
jgi:RNA polymerase-binding transcription factor DksA